MTIIPPKRTATATQQVNDNKNVLIGNPLGLIRLALPDG
jgi:hypothetical protein